MSSFLRRTVRTALTLVAAAVAACADPVSVSDRPSTSADESPSASHAEATLAWNKVARDLVAKHSTSAPASIRTFALLSVAQYNAIVAAEKAASRSAAAIASGQRGATSTPNRKHEDFAAGEEVGRAAAAPLIARAETDGYFAPFTGTVPQCDGCWLPSSPPAFATLGQAKTYFLGDPARFRPAPPPTFGSPAFLAALAEVRQIADTRTAAQDSIAKFWALPAGTVGAQGYLNAVAADLVQRYRRSEREGARTLALLNIAAYDALVASHAAKYHYWLIRPSQADPGIVRAIGLPSFPAYPSNHATLVAVAATVLGARFPAERPQLDAMAEQGAISRVYGGIHYRFDTDAGLALGRKVAAWTLAHDVVGHAPFVLQ
jgi:membrane-associated phospholipid phosphatase